MATVAVVSEREAMFLLPTMQSCKPGNLTFYITKYSITSKCNILRIHVVQYV